MSDKLISFGIYCESNLYLQGTFSHFPSWIKLVHTLGLQCFQEPKSLK